jgi:FKBP-type peptidyl-prolyl cis-trans isomerase SlyD
MSTHVVGAGMAVAIYYTVKDETGAVVDSTKGRGPLAYLHGKGQIVRGLEAALEGKGKDAHLVVTVAPADAYGEHRPEGLFKVKRSAVPAHIKLEVGRILTMQGPQASAQNVRIHALESEEIVLDRNHPMAGRTLTFDVTIAGVRPATDEENSHGHVHGPGGHHH